MIEAPIPSQEASRLHALRSLDLLDTPPEERFDRFTRLAKRLFGVSTALVSLVDADRQWFKSRQGLDADETPREISFCGHAILGRDVFLVPDTQGDERFRDNPLVTGAPHIRFYAGYPLSAADGSKIGTLCLIDPEPREFAADDEQLLRDLGAMVEEEFATVRMATLDELTGITNRRGFQLVGGKALEVCQRMKRPASLLFIDLDRFKAINDELGHAGGDRALREFAQVLLGVFRDSDVVARLGGDEFAVLVVGTPENAMKDPLRRLSESVVLRNAARDPRYPLLYSPGVVGYDPERHASIDALLEDADQRMYERKRSHGAR